MACKRSALLLLPLLVAATGPPPVGANDAAEVLMHRRAQVAELEGLLEVNDALPRPGVPVGEQRHLEEWLLRMADPPRTLVLSMAADSDVETHCQPFDRVRVRGVLRGNVLEVRTLRRLVRHDRKHLQARTAASVWQSD
jgi:hypothetical protein